MQITKEPKVAAVPKQRGGLFLVNNQSEAANVLGAVRLRYPTSNIVVSVSNLTDVQRLVKSLRERISGHVLTVDEYDRQQPAIVVGSHHLLPNSLSERWSIVVAVGKQTALASRITTALAGMPEKWRYAIIEASARLDSSEEQRIAELYGPLLWSPDSESDRCDIVQYSVEPPLTSDPVHGSGQRSKRQTRKAPTFALDVKRQQIWHAETRNGFLTKLALAAANGDFDRLLDLGVPVEDDDSGLLKNGTAVLVESAVHGRALAKLLPDWTLRTEISTSDDEYFAWPSSITSRSIATFTAADRNAFNVGCIIRADGTQTPWKEAWGPKANQYRQEALVIELTGPSEL